MRTSRLLVIALLVLVLPTAAHARVRQPTLVGLTSTPALYPAFSPSIHDYVVRCHDETPVRFTTWAAAGTTPFVDGKAGRTATVSLVPGAAATIEGRNSSGANAYYVRCLPSDFPSWTATGAGSSWVWYVTTPSVSLGKTTAHYIAIFDGNGVPVWWYRTVRVPMDAKILPGPTPLFAFASYPAASKNYEVRRLDGSLVQRVVSPDGHIDDHELQRLANGDLVFLVYRPKEHVDLTAYGGPADAAVLEAEIEEVSPTGQLVWSWSTDGQVDLSESARWLRTIIGTPVVIEGPETTYDFFHANAVSIQNGVVLLSLRHTDGIYAIDRSTGNILWKLGGTPTSQSLTVVHDPDGAQPLGGQHDVRFQPDGTVTVFDNGTFLGRAPRAARYRIDPAAHTATLLEQVSDPTVPTSLCCGSARRLVTGDWVVAWGGDPVVGEYRPDGTAVYRLRFDDSLFSYRAVPVSVAHLSAATLRAAMDARAARAT